MKHWLKSERWMVRVFLFGRTDPIVWVTNDYDSIGKHLPLIGTEFGDETVTAFDFTLL